MLEINMKTTTSQECQPAGCEDTRERILLASQRLFAEKGFDATSVRDITTEAKCNVASVNYHFGGKDNLYLETFRSTLAVLRDQRLRALAELMAREPAPTLEEFLESFAEGFIDPLVDDSQGRMAREMFDPRLPPNVFVEEFIHPILERALTALERFGPRLESVDARLCIMSMVGQLLHVIRAHHLFAGHDDTDGVAVGLADYIPHFVRFSVGGIRACATRPAADADEAAAVEVVK
jgi:AcrR family transcriptional regulator